MDHPSYLHDFAIVLGVGALTSALFRRLNQPTILGYLMAGFIVGPYLVFPMITEPQRVTALSEFGVVLVMFVIGLEFQLSKLWKVLPTSGFAALIQMGSLLYVGFLTGQFLGWSDLESIFLGASICISSTMIVSKLFEEKEVSSDVKSFVLGILVVQDVAAIALITAMSAVTVSGQVSTLQIILTLGRLALTLAAFIAGGLLIVPRLVRAVDRMSNKETLVITSIGICFCFSLLAEYLNYSVALGAFVAGLLVSESGKGHEIEILITPIKDMFVAIFFVAVGMSVDPRLALTHLGPALLVFGVVVLTQLISVALGGILFGNGFRQSITSGLALGQIGEFAFIISGLGVAGGVLGEAVQPVVVTVAILTAFSTPLAMTHAGKLVKYFDRHVPDRVKNILVFYEAWFDKSRKVNAKRETSRAPAIKAVQALALDTLILIVLLFSALTWSQEAFTWLGGHSPLDENQVELGYYTLLGLISIPPVLGIVRNTNAFVFHYSERLVAGSARRGVIMTQTSQQFLHLVLRISVILGVGIPLAAVLRPVIGAGALALPLCLALVIMLAVLWKSAGKLDHEIVSEAQRLVEFLDSQRSVGVTNHHSPASLMPDISSLVGIEIEANSPWIGYDLRALDLRAATGSLILAIHRDGKDVAMPTGSDILMAGDLLMITGTTESMSLARARLRNPLPATD